MAEIIRTRPATDQYREGWDRVFGRRGRNCSCTTRDEVCPEIGCQGGWTHPWPDYRKKFMA